MIKNQKESRIFLVGVVTALSVALGGCWELMEQAFGPKGRNPSTVVVKKDFVEYVNDEVETQTTTTYADGHQVVEYKREYDLDADYDYDLSTMILNADGSVRSHSGLIDIDPRTVGKDLLWRNIQEREVSILQYRKNIAKLMNDPEPDLSSLAWLERETKTVEQELQRYRSDYVARYGETPPSILGVAPPSIEEMLDVGSARPTGVTGTGAFTPPDVPTGPPPAAIVRPPMPPVHID